MRQQKIVFNSQYLYENQSSLILEEPCVAVDPSIFKREDVKTMNGEIVTGKDKKYDENTNVLINSELYSNSNIKTIEVSRVVAKIDSKLLE